MLKSAISRIPEANCQNVTKSRGHGRALLRMDNGWDLGFGQIHGSYNIDEIDFPPHMPMKADVSMEFVARMCNKEVNILYSKTIHVATENLTPQNILRDSISEAS